MSTETRNERQIGTQAEAEDTEPELRDPHARLRWWHR